MISTLRTLTKQLQNCKRQLVIDTIEATLQTCITTAKHLSQEHKLLITIGNHTITIQHPTRTLIITVS